MYFGVAGAILGFLGVAAGAFGAHALRGSLAPDRLEIFETAVRYQLVHALVLLTVPALGSPAAGWAFLAGTVIFSGSLYLLVLTDIRWLGAVTPIGGVLMLLGWLLLAISAYAGRSGASGG
jgi:uncharacterized membrane protein YgdD (TMEM256/DUF423 family)